MKDTITNEKGNIRLTKSLMYLVPVLMALYLYVGDLSYDPTYNAVECPPSSDTVSRVDEWTGADGHEYEETNCYDSKTGSRISGQCCCFVASASGLNPEQIDAIRNIRDGLNVTVPGFKPLISDTYKNWGPSVADYLRKHEGAKRIVHDAIAPVAFTAIDINNKLGESGLIIQMKAQQSKASLR